MTQMKFDWEGLKKKFIWFEKAEIMGIYIFIVKPFELADNTVHSTELYSERACIQQKEH